MNINRVEVNGYRNLESGEVYPKPGINVIYGENAQGKTNFIESMWMFTGGRSFRGSKDADIIKFGEGKSLISGEFLSGDITNKVSIEISNEKRTAEFNGFNEGAASNIIGNFRAAVFSPSHLSIVKDGPDVRRRMIDAAICQMKPVYTKIISGFNRTLRHRNALLREISICPGLSETLGVWDEKFSEYSAAVIEERIKYLEILRKISKEIYEGISGGREKLDIQYHAPGIEKALETKEQIYPEVLERLKKSRESDINSGFTSFGAHRHDLKILLDGKPVKSFGSQGQQRSCALAIKLSEARTMELISGEKPVVFLDDVMSELDLRRRRYTAECMKGYQTFITCCDPPDEKTFYIGSLFEVTQGKIIKR